MYVCPSLPAKFPEFWVKKNDANFNFHGKIGETLLKLTIIRWTCRFLHVLVVKWLKTSVFSVFLELWKFWKLVGEFSIILEFWKFWIMEILEISMTRKKTIITEPTQKSIKNVKIELCQLFYGRLIG